jgi:hypothetical protein
MTIPCCTNIVHEFRGADTDRLFHRAPALLLCRREAADRRYSACCVGGFTYGLTLLSNPIILSHKIVRVSIIIPGTSRGEKRSMQRLQKAKVFWFFFSKQTCFLPFFCSAARFAPPNDNL